jgi:hypothetical protein
MVELDYLDYFVPSTNASCASFFVPRNFKFIGDDRNNKFTNRRWQLPPMQRTSPIQPSSTPIVFAGEFIITY